MPREDITLAVNGPTQNKDIQPAADSAIARSRSSAIYMLPLVALTAVYTAGLSFASAKHLSVPGNSSVIYPLVFSLLLTGWVRIDRRMRGLSVPFEFDFFVYFAWPVFVPYYLFRTRRWIGLLFGIGIWGLFVAPFITATTISVLVDR